MSDERREHHHRDEEYGHAAQDDIDDVAQVADDDGALTTQGGVDRPGHLTVHVRDRLTALGGPPLERGQSLQLEAQQFAAFRSKRALDSRPM